MTLNLNTFPYNDDFDPNKQFYQILFRPSVAVQARELTQMQSVIKDQIEKFGKHIFKEGAVVIPGSVSVDVAYPYIKLEPTFSSIDIVVSNFVGKRIVGLTSGATALVLQGIDTNIIDPDTLYLKYDAGISAKSFNGTITNGSQVITAISVDATAQLTVGAFVYGTGIPAATYITEIISATSVRISNGATASTTVSMVAETKTAFVEGEVIRTVTTNNSFHSATLVASNASGLASKAQITRGVYFVNGRFVLVDDQTILLEKYSAAPSYKIGIDVLEEIITAELDDSLNDPAGGSTNFNAPGADRLFIDLLFTKIALDDPTTENFIELIRIKDGQIQKMVDKTEYSELEKTLARRTYDESGDYTTRAFPVEIKEHLNTGTNGGVYTASEGGDEDKLVLAVGAGKAYVKGYEIENQGTVYVDVDKSRDFLTENNYIVYPALGNYVEVDTVSGVFNVSTYESVNLKSAVNNTGSTIGTAKVRSMAFVSGTPGTSGAVYRLYLFDIVMTGGNLFEDVKSIASTTGVANTVGTTASLNTTEAATAIYQVPEYALRDITDESYTVKRYLTGTMVGENLTVTVASNELATPGNVVNYHVTMITASATALGNGFTDGEIINMQAGGRSITLGGSPVGRQVTFSITGASGSTLGIIATVTKTNLSPKTKTKATIVETKSHASTIQLTKADIFKLVSVVDTSTTLDITDQYILDNGQRDSYYDRGKLIFKTGYVAPVGNVDITYEYFNHGVGDYFTVASYNPAIDYKDIPTFTSPTTGQYYDLINCLDFRPRINDTGTGFSVTTEFTAPETAVSMDYEYYVGRIDKLVLDTYGNFKILKGASGVNPQAPKDPADAMVLYQIDVPPYTFNTIDVAKKQLDNKGYTMRDIGALEKRISSLEYYTALSLLEQDTANLFVDDGDGNNRFKLGFVVDNFTSHKIGDVASPAYRCAVDSQQQVLRPQFVSSNVPFVLDGTSSGYQKTGDLITLPYTTAVLIDQPFASETLNINPYNVFAWIGILKMTPNGDEWYETQRAPDRILETDDGLADALAGLNGQVIWNDWETTWLGKEISRVPVPSNKVTNSTGTNHHGVGQGIGVLAATMGRLPNEVINFAVGAGLSDAQRATPGRGGTYLEGIFRDTVTREVGQTRTGVQTTIVPTVKTQVLDDRIVETSVIPYMRSRVIEFSVENMKPNTRVYPFFDNVDVTIYTAPTGGANGDPLVTDNSGRVSGTFNLPNNDVHRFLTGSKTFKLTDSSTNTPALTSTIAESNYHAQGILQTQQATILSTRTAEIVTNTVTDSRVAVISQIEETIKKVRYSDPLAQTFVIDTPGGVFISKVDIFFATKDATGIPVTLQIRNTVNGYPGQYIVPFSEKSLTPDQVSTSTDGTVKTTFTFDSPVYLADGQEFCLVLLANSDSYNVYVSTLGGNDTATGEKISQQPYAGSLFKSQNASTWTPSQEQDLKFTIHRCVFATNTVGNYIVNNSALVAESLDSNPFYTTSASTTVKVYDRDHGLKTGESSVISGVAGDQNGIPAVELNATHVVTVLDTDNYTITVTTAADATGLCGGSTVKSLVNTKIDTIQVVAQTMVFPGTQLGYAIRTTDFATGLKDGSYASIEAGSNVSFTDSKLILSPTNEDDGKSFILRAQLSTQQDNISPVIDLARYSLVAVSNRINSNDTDELEPMSGEALARYITKRINIVNPATSVKVMFSAVRPPNSTIKVYVKYLPVGETTNFDDKDYVEVPAESYPSADYMVRKDYSFFMEDIEEFDSFAIKIVMLADDSADVPLIKDFRVVALA